MASRRTGVGAIAYEWERAIPFVPWTIVPYWSIDLLYAVSIFICTTRRELDRHAQRLLAVQLVSVVCFLAFPLRFSFERPVTGGIFGALFTALGSFDKPFNQAPSLHISLLVVIWTRLAAHLSSKAARWLLHVWMTLIAVSILTTFQHHFIDLPTGIVVGLAALWALPDEGASPLRGIVFTKDRGRRRLAAMYAAGALGFAIAACAGGVWLWLFWPAIALAIVAFSYASIGARGFQKGSDGRLSAGAYALLAPYLGAAWINSRLWTRRHPLAAEVREGVWIGRVPRASELAQFAAVVDLCAELPCAGGQTADGRAQKPTSGASSSAVRPLPSALSYCVVPVLDLTVPDRASLRAAAEAIEDARRHGAVLVCCALGYSRSAAAIVAWLLMTRRATSVAEAMQLVRVARPAIVLKGEHHTALESFA